jgi:G:T-mismatch repair DNA endonuclease (very short patch repair protein)
MKQTQEYIDKRVETRKKNNSYVGQGLGRKGWNVGMKGYTNSGSFKKGIAHPRKKIEMNLQHLKSEYLSGKSTYDLSKVFNVSQKTLFNRLEEIGIIRKNKHSELTKQKIKDTLIRKGIKPKERFSGNVWNKGLTKEDPRVKKNMLNLLEARKTQVLPKKDTKPEVKIQNLLKQLNIEFYTHQYMNIPHGYQCDIFIPKQEGINRDTIIECFGIYWHRYPTGREIDTIRCQELREKGFRVLVFWENEIKEMQLNDLYNKL